MLVIGPKASFPAWREVVTECVNSNAPDGNAEPFTILTTSGDALQKALTSGGTRFVISYDLMIQNADILTTFASQNKVHLVLDEGSPHEGGLWLAARFASPQHRAASYPSRYTDGDADAPTAFGYPVTGSTSYGLAQASACRSAVAIPQDRFLANFMFARPSKTSVSLNHIVTSGQCQWQTARWLFMES
ncbi:hypothetical protein PSQ19_17485 [Devosia algicola]|uniref:Extracellular solute-binding protein n=1 Tax=Devosia algicola TaxID=3026418 RepID=A0ABY7YME4_9HYPH|nr:hypothetical protein [Devosia algicola]WDR02382.1 hypothetical protein PSQ19_17485 [Devosia algicola]